MSDPECTAAFREAVDMAGVEMEFNGTSIDLDRKLYGNQSELNIKVSASLTGLIQGTADTQDVDDEGNVIYKSIGKDIEIDCFDGDFENVTYTT